MWSLIKARGKHCSFQGTPNLEGLTTGDEFVRGFRVGLPLTEFKSKVVVFSKDMGTKTCLP